MNLTYKHTYFRTKTVTHKKVKFENRIWKVNFTELAFKLSINVKFDLILYNWDIFVLKVKNAFKTNCTFFP